MRTLPPAALLGGEPGSDDPSRWPENELAGFLHYIDLCNEQVYLRDTHRVSKRTWSDWLDGMRHTLELPYFRRAWSYAYHECNRLEGAEARERSYARLAAEVPPKPSPTPSAAGSGAS